MEVIIPAEPEPISLDMERTALIVVDMQNAFAKKGGMLDVLGAFNEARATQAVVNNRKIIEVFRRMGIPVIFLRMTYGPDLSQACSPDSPNYWKQSGLVAMRQHPEWKGRFLTINTWDWEIIDELKPITGEIIINKSRYSGFVNTELDDFLKARHIKYVVFIGIATNVCVESTLRDAYFHEYFPVLVSDACNNTGPDFIQEATIWNVTSVFGWVTTTENLLKALDLS
jgi:ureidoacrylate peracid hydrolase